MAVIDKPPGGLDGIDPDSITVTSGVIVGTAQNLQVTQVDDYDQKQNAKKNV